MNAIVCLNVNDYMAGRCRNSFHAAATRWGCKYVELTRPLAAVHHFWQKTMVSAQPEVTGFDRVLQLDTDMLIRSDCPSPFDLVPVDNVGVVSRVQPHRLGPHRFFARGKHLQARRMGLVPYTKERSHLNAGFILYSPARHRELLKRWREAGERCDYAHVTKVPEQMALSCLLLMLKVPTTWLPMDFNTVLAGSGIPRGVMRTYIYHFNGPAYRPLKEKIKAYQWEV